MNLQASNQIANTSVVTLNNAGAIFDIGAQSDTVGGVSLQNGSITGTTGTLTSTSAFDLQNGSVSAKLGGTVALNKTTAATVTLSGANTYTGATNVLAGTLQTGINNALPVGTAVTVGDATTLVGPPAAALTIGAGFSQAIASLTLVASSGGGSTNVNINAGSTLQVNGNISLIDNAVFPGDAFAGNINGPGFLDLGGAVRNINVASQNIGQGLDLKISAIIQNGGVNVNGTNSATKGTIGGVQFSGANTYAGLTTINSGILRAANNSALGADGAGNPANGTIVNVGGSLMLQSGITIGNEALTLNGQGAAQTAPASNTARIGALVGFSGTSTYGGAITIGSTNTVITANDGTTLNLTGGITKNGVNLIVGNVGVGAHSGTVNIGVAGNNATGISGTSGVGSFNSDVLFTAGTTNLLVSNPYLGATWLNNGAVVNANVAGALPSLVSDGGTALTRTGLIMDADTLGNFPVANYPTAPLGAIGGTGGSTLNFGANQAVQFVASGPTSPGTSTINLNNFTLTIGTTAATPGTVSPTTFTGIITGTGVGTAVIKDGTSTQVFTGANTYLGDTAITGGTLQIGNGNQTNAAPGAGIVKVFNGAFLDINLANNGNFNNAVVLSALGGTVRGINSGGNTQFINGVISGNGNFIQNAGGISVFTNLNSYQAGTTITGAGSQVTIGTAAKAGLAGSGDISVDNDGVLKLVNVSGNVLANNISSAAGLGTIVGELALPTSLTGAITNGAGQIALTQNGPGAIILNNVGNTYTGANTINSGIVQIGTSLTAGSIGSADVEIANGGSLVVVNIGGPTANVLANNVTGSNLVGGVGTLNVSSANDNLLTGTLNDGTTGTLKLVQSGTGKTTVQADNNFTGGTTISAGILQVGNAGASGTLGSGNVVDNGALIFDRTDTTTFANNISGTGTVTKNSFNFLTISGNNSYDGLTRINDGAVIMGSATALGSTAAGTFVASGAVLDLNGQTVGAENLQIAGVGTGAYNGVLANNSASPASLQGAVALTANSTISTIGDITLNGVISGNFNLTKVDTGILTLNAVNNYSGTTFIQQGILIAGNASALGSIGAGTVVANGASLEIANGILTLAEPLIINGAGFGGIGALTQALNGSSTFNGPITVATNSTIGTNGTGTFTLNGTIDKTDTTLTLTGGGTINVNAAITGGNFGTFNDDLIVDGVTTNLNAANTYLGPTFIRNNGVLNANIANALPTLNGRTSITIDGGGASSLVLNNVGQSIASLQSSLSGSSVVLNGNTLTIGFGTGLNTNGTANANFVGVISGTGGLIKDDTSTQILSGTNTFTGNVNVNGGILSVQNGAAIADSVAVIVANPGTLNLIDSETIGSLAGDGFVTLNTKLLTTGGNGDTTTFSGVMSGNGANSLIKTGTGTFTLSGTNTFTGTAVVNNGILSLQNGAAIADVVAVTVTSPGALDLVNSETIGSLAGSGNTTLNANTLTTGGNGNSTIYSGVMSGNGVNSLIKTGAGTMTLTGANTFTGTALVNQGILSLQNGAAIADVVAVTVTSPGTLNLVNSESIGSLAGNGSTTLNAQTLTTGGNNTSTTFSGVISGVNGSLVKEGTGNFIISGTNTFTGPVTINDGTLSVQNGAAIEDNVAVTINDLFPFNAPVSTLNLVDSETIGSLAGNGKVTLNSRQLTTGGNNNSTTYSGVISGFGALALVKEGTGIFTVSGNNTYSGDTTVNNGTLRAGIGTNSFIPGNAFGVNSAVMVNSPGTLDLAGFDNTIGSLDGNSGATVNLDSARLTSGTNNNNSTYDGAIVGTTGGFTKVGTGTFLLDNNSSATFTGHFDVFDGIVLLDSSTTDATGQGDLFIGDGIGAQGSAIVRTLQFGEINNLTAVTIRSDGQLDINGFGDTIGSLDGVAASSVLLGSGRITTGGNNNDADYAGTISGFGGRFEKEGTGIQILSGNNTYTGGTTLNDGTLAAGSTKAFGNGDLTVNGGLLRTEGGPRIVDIGDGNILLANGVYQATVGGLNPGTQHDQLVTTGTGTATNGVLRLVQTNNFTLRPGEQVKLVLASGGVTGGTSNGTPLAAANVEGLSQFSNTPLLVPVVNAYTKAVILEVEQGSFAALKDALGLHCNTLAVAEALDSVARRIGNKTGVIDELNYLDVQSLESLPGNLDRISPEELTAVFDITKSLANVQTANVTRRMDDIRLSMTDEPATLPTSYGKGGYSKDSKAVIPPAPSEQKRFGSFLNGSGEFTSIGGTNCASGYDLETGGVTLGVDYLFTNHFAAGVTFGYTNTGADLQNGGKIDVDGGKLGLYGTYFSDGFYVDSSVTGGLNSYKTKRSTPNGTTATASPDGQEINASIATGYDLKFGTLTIGPIASFQYTYTNLDGFTEDGQFAPLKIQSESAESARSALGFRATFDAKVGSVTIRPEIRASWQHEFSDTGSSLTSSFAKLDSDSFTVEGTTTGRDSAVVSAGVAVIWNATYSAYVYYDGEIGRDNYDSHNVSAGFRVSF